jgi:membrane fusion protein, heavy metal efflux system
MTANKHNKQRLAIAAVVAVGVVLGGLILGLDQGPAGGAAHEKHADHAAKHGHPAAGESHDAREEKLARGPHGGRLFTDGSYGLEVTIYEQGVEPQFRLYTYQNGKPLEPKETSVQLALERLGRAPQVFKFSPENDYLKGDAVVDEPHSFKVALTAAHAGKTYAFGYEQAEVRVTMSDTQLQQAGVELATAGPARIGTRLQLLGEVRYNGDRTVQVVPRLPGRVESVTVSAGDRVRKGQVLATLASLGLADLRGESLAAQKRLALARATYQREKTLWEEKISAEQDYLQARAALHEAEIVVQGAQQKLAALGAQQKGGLGAAGKLTLFEIRSPIDGVVTDKRISVGEALKEDSNVFTVSDLATVWVESPVAAKDLGAITAGQKATVRANAFAATADGRIAYVSALVGEETRSATARIVLPNPKGIWRPGLPVSIEVVADEAEVPVAVAAEALQTVRDWRVVFGRYGEHLEARPLELGRSDGRLVEVLGGLQAGERYAAKNSFLIKAELGKAGASHDH